MILFRCTIDLYFTSSVRGGSINYYYEQISSQVLTIEPQKLSNEMQWQRIYEKLGMICLSNLTDNFRRQIHGRFAIFFKQ